MEESDVPLQQEYSEEKSLVLSPDTSSSSTCSGLEIEFIRDINAHECADANLVSCPAIYIPQNDQEQEVRIYVLHVVV